MLVSNILDCINSILTIAQHEVYLKFDKALEPFGITPGQYDVLHCIWLRKNQVTTPKIIAGFVCLELASVSGILDRMQKRGLINRALDETNHRRIMVTTTKKSEDMKVKLQETVKALNKEVRKGFTKNEWDAFMQGLQKISNNENIII